MQRRGDGALAPFNVKRLVDNGVLRLSGTWQINTPIMSLDPPVYKDATRQCCLCIVFSEIHLGASLGVFAREKHEIL